MSGVAPWMGFGGLINMSQKAKSNSMWMAPGEKNSPRPIFHELLSRAASLRGLIRTQVFGRRVQLRQPCSVLTQSHFHKISKRCWTLTAHQARGWVLETDEKDVAQIPESSHSSWEGRPAWRASGAVSREAWRSQKIFAFRIRDRDSSPDSAT